MKLSLLFALMALIFASCGETKQEKLDRQYEEAVVQGTLLHGMSREHVTSILGEPFTKKQSDDTKTEMWTYVTLNNNCYSYRFIVFKDGKLTKWN
jgi:outer membrane protein assembly factor BamE (lipoprotein component of BamABCDE complex)